jgi:Zn-dependent protease with chaperone function
MATDFFHQQDAARRRSGLLVFYFALAILTLIGLTYLLAAFLFVYLPNDDERTRSLWDPWLLAVVVVVVLAVVGGGSLLKTAQLAAGGKAVALMMGGREVPGDARDPQSRRLLNVVEEMAIAAGVAVPPVYLLPDEAGINAFAAGHAPGDAVVAVSQGCLEYLTRDELQGVVGHEFSHILNGDMRLNLRLLGLIFGILALSVVGRVLMSAAATRRPSRSDGEGRGAQGVWLLGVGLYFLGLSGAFFGRLIQAAVSRQREFLADASAVQFTRNPDGIAGALKKIGGLSTGSSLVNPRVDEVGHMLFADGIRGSWFATHPPLAVRIRKLDPQFDGKFPAVHPVAVREEPAAASRPGRLPPILGRLPHGAAPAVVAAAAAPEAAAAQVGRVTQREVAYGEAMHADFPAPPRAAALEPFGARALVYCLLLDPRPAVRDVQLAQLRAAADPRDYQQTLRLADAVGRLPDAARLPLADLAIPALRRMSPRQHEAFRAQVEGLIRADRQVSLFEYALYCVLKRSLDEDFRRARPSARRGSAAALGPRVAVVVSLLAWEGQPEEGPARAAFEAGMRRYPGGDAYRLLPREQCSLPEFDAALRELAEAVPEVKRKVVVSCAACVLADRQVTVRERELLRAICAVLGCPMPPLFVEASRQPAP